MTIFLFLNKGYILRTYKLKNDKNNTYYKF